MGAVTPALDLARLSRIENRHGTGAHNRKAGSAKHNRNSRNRHLRRLMNLALRRT